MASTSTAATSKPGDRRPPPPLFTPYPMLPYYDPYAFALPMGYMQQPPLPPPPPAAPSSSFVPPPLPIPIWDENTYIYTQTLPPLSWFVPPPPQPIPYWDKTYFYTQTLHPPWSPPPLSPQELRNKILKQIEYYFSDDNLATDVYLKKNMDDNGWVPVTLIAGFRQISGLTNDIGLILFTMATSSKTVEVEKQKLRRRTSWKKWIAFRAKTNPAQN